MAKYYTRITMKRMAQLLDLSVDVSTGCVVCVVCQSLLSSYLIRQILTSDWLPTPCILSPSSCLFFPGVGLQTCTITPGFYYFILNLGSLKCPSHLKYQKIAKITLLFFTSWTFTLRSGSLIKMLEPGRGGTYL